VGTTISCKIQDHLQSMVLATDRIGLELMLPHMQCYSVLVSYESSLFFLHYKKNKGNGYYSFID